MAVDSFSGDIVASPAQADKSPGIQAAGDQNLNSAAGGTCHQCRHKIPNVAAACKNQRNGTAKPCCIKLCCKCLFNRYGEIAEEVNILGDWHCPKCRGICNCSVCMKRRGHRPTGKLSNAAKTTGFSSVSEMLVNGAAYVNEEKVGPVMADSPEKEGSVSPGKRGKENSLDGKVNSNVPNSVSKSSKKAKGDHNCIVDDRISSKKRSDFSEKKPKKMKCNRAGERASSSEKDLAGSVGNHIKKEDPFVDITPPVGLELTSVAGIDMNTEDIGNALQFLEFCSVFGKILGVRKGQAEQVLQDLFHGRSARRGKYSTTIQFHFHLLSVLLHPEDGQSSPTESPAFEISSWFKTLKKCFSESQSILKDQVMDSLEKAADYETLDASTKLRVLNILCDEILGTEHVRNWIEEQNMKFAEKVKEAKQKEKSLKQKTKNGTGEASIPKDGDSLSVSDQVEESHDKSGAVQDQVNVLESKGMLLDANRTCDAMRINPLFLDHRGHAYWKLSCFGKPDILHQEIARGDDTLDLNEKWFGLDTEGKEVIEKHVQFLRKKRSRR